MIDYDSNRTTLATLGQRDHSTYRRNAPFSHLVIDPFFDPPTIEAVIGGVITVDFSDSQHVYHGFVRAADGTTIVFDCPGVSTHLGNGTFPISINSVGVVVGSYNDANGTSHGFLRATDGHIVSFDVADAHFGTDPADINTAGIVTGAYG